MYISICIYAYSTLWNATPPWTMSATLIFFSSCNFRLGDSEQNNDLNLQVHECCMQHTLKHNVKIWFVMVLMLVLGKCISRCMIFVFQCAWIPNLINIYVICKFVLCFFVAVYFYWFYMCRHCSLSCEIHLVNNMTMFWNVNFIFLVSHFIWKHCSKMCMYKCNPCWASNVDNQKKKILLLFCRLLFNVLYCIIILQKLSNL